MSSILAIATSGMRAAVTRLEVSASNVANARSSGPLPSADDAIKADFPPAYVPLRVDQADLAGGGTLANVSAVNPSFVSSYDPKAPFADQDGMVAAPNVDLADEAVQQIVARFSYAMNAQVVRTYSQMMKTLQEIKV